jgi:uncharacterized protein (DUF2252 family)
MHWTDPARLARRQVALDGERMRRFPGLGPRKAARMLASPLAFLRGAAPLFYEILAEDAELAAGPADQGWIVGDAHCENFGAFQALNHGSGVSRKVATFDLNDFDEAVHGPWRWDVLRLSTSVILASRALGVTGTKSVAMAGSLLDGYCEAIAGAPLPAQPRPVAKLVQRTADRTRQDLLTARTTLVAGKRRFARGERYWDLPAEILALLPKALESYAARLPDVERPGAAELQITDAAQRIAGTGSLGALRIAVLSHGKGAPDGHWLFDMKEQFAPAASPLQAGGPLPFAEMRVAACKACLAQPPRMLGATQLEAASLLVRRLAPQEDKLDFLSLDQAELEPLTRFLGARLGAAHARGAGGDPKSNWSSADKAGLLERAVALAGLHEAIYLAYCALSPVSVD